MAKTKKELEEIKSHIEELKVVLKELSEEELKEVTGGDVSSANIVGSTKSGKSNPDKARMDAWTLVFD